MFSVGKSLCRRRRRSRSLMLKGKLRTRNTYWQPAFAEEEQGCDEKEGGIPSLINGVTAPPPLPSLWV